MNEPDQAQTPIPETPYLCPHCASPGDIMMTALQTLLVFWHGPCRKILNVQLMAIPAQAQSRIVVPGRMQ